MAEITPIVMPKWGLSMKEGTVTAWLVDEGTEIKVGMPILEVETDKIANAGRGARSGHSAPQNRRARRSAAGQGAARG